MRKVFAYLARYKWRMALGLFIKAIGTVAELFLPMIMGKLLFCHNENLLAVLIIVVQLPG